MMKSDIVRAFKKVQDYICGELERLDGAAKFKEDLWQREGGGGGRTRVIQQGEVFEKGGVNFSEVYGPVSDLMRKQLKMEGDEFYATGVSIVLHPHHPFVPIMHMNIRYFQLDDKDYWFGGGIDMTPHYVDKKMAAKFHDGLNKICQKYHPDFYTNFKKWADDYFFIPHRNETRGVGGIFYDHQRALNDVTKEELLHFAIDLGNAFPHLYEEQYLAGYKKEYSEENIQFRNLRRGRYVEFNLVHDRGTQFGLKTGGRIESILMSLPEHASWLYNFQAKTGSPEESTLLSLKKDVDWLSLLK
ncbi:MAG: oxygen-dependent coproporphyrinogen oxidase [Crocinitomicaceae bacterium]|nr:oxygen-dependent coproporphyrinogen oxidase [Crocinitomicaceae bacterium]